MITKEEYKTINEYKCSLVSWHEGHCVTVTRQMWDALYPIVHKYQGYNGTLFCRYCCLELMRFSYNLWTEYKESRKKKVSDEQ